ncbi:hypothetical protein BXZ70DRAFT_909193 [Cristinia sonorae]|uniref:Uncharacterized protein n=1 Tax=Cristinia sonorae TaxID=1940300 RepID=A0A8K0UJD3_9AGAR|nr:hypothetical protein BXZ70DRAFT_909193 [Cristinia sonorae]
MSVVALWTFGLVVLASFLLWTLSFASARHSILASELQLIAQPPQPIRSLSTQVAIDEPHSGPLPPPSLELQTHPSYTIDVDTFLATLLGNDYEARVSDHIIVMIRFLWTCSYEWREKRAAHRWLLISEYLPSLKDSYKFVQAREDEARYNVLYNHFRYALAHWVVEALKEVRRNTIKHGGDIGSSSPVASQSGLVHELTVDIFLKAADIPFYADVAHRVEIASSGSFDKAFLYRYFTPFTPFITMLRNHPVWIRQRCLRLMDLDSGSDPLALVLELVVVQLGPEASRSPHWWHHEMDDMQLDVEDAAAVAVLLLFEELDSDSESD